MNGRIRSWRSLGFLEPVSFGNLLVSRLAGRLMLRLGSIFGVKLQLRIFGKVTVGFVDVGVVKVGVCCCRRGLKNGVSGGYVCSEVLNVISRKLQFHDELEVQNNEQSHCQWEMDYQDLRACL
ncbi:hypothetical protein Tco_0534820 [Tanacetum coccineum]